MGLVILLVFILVPLVEIGVFIEVGGWIGLWPTLGLILLTAALGSWQLRAQGLSTLARARQQMDAGEMPARELFDGLCLIIAGALLLTPGFVTDAVGLALFVPAFRGLLRRHLARHLKVRASVHMRERRYGDGSTTIDADYRVVPDEQEPLPPGDGRRS